MSHTRYTMSARCVGAADGGCIAAGVLAFTETAPPCRPSYTNRPSPVEKPSSSDFSTRDMGAHWTSSSRSLTASETNMAPHRAKSSHTLSSASVACSSSDECDRTFVMPFGFGASVRTSTPYSAVNLV